MRYIDAAKAYESAINRGDNSITLLQKAGDAHYFNTDMTQANKWYDLLISEYKDQVDPEYLFRFAHSLEGIGNYKAANKWMKAFAKASNKNDKRITDFAQKKQTLDDVLAIPQQFELNNLDINTKYSDFGPSYYDNKLVYSSAIDTSYFIKTRYQWNEQPFLNLYIGKINATGNKVTREKEFSKVINTKYHEATVAFAENGERIYFTRNNYDGDLHRDNEGVNHLKLYTAERTNVDGHKEWKNVQELPFNSNEYSTGHPTISKDGKKLYFVSDMPGTIGFTDIFVVDILGDNTYSTPQNLGPKINTSGREMFPFITEDKLYLASDGHLGIGGLDVFESNFSNGIFENPKNLGKPLNSELDDFGFIIDEKDSQGFVCSNREGGKGDDDIYAIQRINPLTLSPDACTQLAKGYVTNARTGERISNATVAIYDSKGNKITETTSKENGDYELNYDLLCNERYEVKVEKTGYSPNNKIFVTSAISSETIVPLDLETIDELIVEDNGLLKIKVGIIFFDLDKDYIRPDAAIELNKIVTLMSQNPNMQIRIESHTDSRSDDTYNIDLSQRRANSTRDYLILSLIHI